MTVDQNGVRPPFDRRRLAVVVALAACGEVLHAQEGARFVERARLHVGGGPTEVLARSARGDLLATAGGEQIAVWEVRAEGPREIARFSTANYVEHLAFDPSGCVLAISGGELQLWDRESSRLAERFRLWRGGPVAWSPDGRFLATCGIGRRVELLECERFRTVRSLALGAEGREASALLWEPDGSALWIAAAGKRSALFRYEIASGVFDADARREVDSFVTRMSWSDGQLVLEGRRRESAGLDIGFDAGHPVGQLSLAFTPDERFALLANDARVAVLEIESGAVRELAVGGPIGAGRAGAEFLLAEPSGLSLWDAALGTRRSRFERAWKPHQRPTMIALGPGSGSCFGGGANRRTSQIDLDGEEPDRDVGVFSAWAIDRSADGERCVLVRYGSSPGLPSPVELRLWDRAKPIFPLDAERWPSATAACLGSGDELVWSAGFFGDARSGTWRRTWPEGAPQRVNDRIYYALAALGRGLVAGLAPQGLDLIDLASGRVLATYPPAQLRGSAGPSLAASPSGRWILTLAGREARLLELLR
ncbi:MAG: hypothetical protein IPN34_19515 [Planctomycetes bacterium]|nr:hypothetical protein [Planctomycetota bacterium]